MRLPHSSIAKLIIVQLQHKVHIRFNSAGNDDE